MLKGTIMSNLRTLMLGATLVGFAALPVAAMTIGTGTNVVLTAVPEVAASAMATTNDTAPADGTTGANAVAGSGVTSMVNADFAGSPVISADGMNLGKVRVVTDNADGSLLVWVDLDKAIAAKSHTFTVTIGKDSQADGSLLLGWTQAELIAALDAQVQG
jgi:hypothetical protein